MQPPTLTEISFNLGLASKKRLQNVENKKENTSAFVSFFKKTSVKPQEINPILKGKGSSEIKQSVKLQKVFSRPNLTMKDMLKLCSVQQFCSGGSFDKEVLEQTEVQIKYAGYIEKEKANVKKLSSLEGIKIPSRFIYSKVNSLSAEAIQKLEKIKPTTLSQASRISGVSPNDINVLMVYMGR